MKQTKKKETLEEIKEQVEAKRVSLAKDNNCNVYSYIIEVSDNDYAIAYIKEPHRLVKKRVYDKMHMGSGISEAGDMIIDSCLLKESDKRFTSELPEHDTLNITLCTKVVDIIEVYRNVIKKK